MQQEDKYYLRYNDRYRRMHEQGFERWVSSPEEYDNVLESVDVFLEWAGGDPPATSIIEFGCGEGFVAEHLLSPGYDYLGLDISESAVEKARKWCGELGENTFMIADIVGDLLQIPDNSRDCAIDNQCFHMLVTDRHRERYLSNVRRILSPGGKLFLREMVQDKEFTMQIRDFADWLEQTGNDYETLHEYTAYKGDECHSVQLPRVPARFNTEDGYRRELQEAGFIVEHFESDGWQCIMYASALIPGRE